MNRPRAGIIYSRDKVKERAEGNLSLTIIQSGHRTTLGPGMPVISGSRILADPQSRVPPRPSIDATAKRNREIRERRKFFQEQTASTYRKRRPREILIPARIEMAAEPTEREVCPARPCLGPASGFPRADRHSRPPRGPIMGSCVADIYFPDVKRMAGRNRVSTPARSATNFVL